MLEVVPNVSEGRDDARVAALAGALAAEGAHVLDVHRDVDHHRAVMTAAGPDPEPLAFGAVRLVAAAVEVLDLRAHDGVHPRVGVVDVVPFVDLDDDEGGGWDRDLLAEVADRIGRLGVPVLGYGLLTPKRAGGERRPVDYRRGLTRAHVEDERLAGPRAPHPSAGVVLLGLRAPLVALNVDLDAEPGDAAALDAAREIAGDVREPGVLQALGLALPEQGRVQVSLNLIALDALGIADAVARVREAADARGHSAGDVEFVGLVGERWYADGLPGVGPDDVIERRYAEATATGGCG